MLLCGCAFDLLSSPAPNLLISELSILSSELRAMISQIIPGSICRTKLRPTSRRWSKLEADADDLSWNQTCPNVDPQLLSDFLEAEPSIETNRLLVIHPDEESA